MKVMKLRIELKDDFHTSGSAQGSRCDVLRCGEKFIIPGSHLKGVIRTEAERIWFSAMDLKPCRITYMTERFHCTNPGACPICTMFGKPNQRDDLEGQGEGAAGYQEGVLRFYDAIMVQGGRSPSPRTHASIDRGTESNVSGALYSVSVLGRGSVFEGFVVMRHEMTEKENRLLRGAVASAGWYGLGKERSRGLGRVEMTLTESSMEELIEELTEKKPTEKKEV